MKLEQRNKLNIALIFSDSSFKIGPKTTNDYNNPGQSKNFQEN